MFSLAMMTLYRQKTKTLKHSVKTENYTFFVHRPTTVVAQYKINTHSRHNFSLLSPP
jgi:myo-inositol-hexaphosphate 3-phosphohydrolase